MAYEIEGKLISKSDTLQRTESFRVREFVIEKTDDIGGRTVTNYVKFQCTQDRTQMVDRFNIGEMVKIHFNIKGSKWEKDGKTNYITNLDAWRMESIKLDQQGIDQMPTETFTASEPPGMVDDLPF